MLMMLRLLSSSREIRRQRETVILTLLQRRHRAEPPRALCSAHEHRHRVVTPARSQTAETDDARQR